MEEDLQPSKGTVNRNRLTILLINGGTEVLQKFIVELLLNFFLQEKKENIKRQVGSVLYQQQFELLYPVDGHPPLIDTLPDILLSFIRHHVLGLQDEPGLQTHTSLLTTIKEYLSTEGFQRYLARRKHELEGNVKLRRAQFEALYSHSHPVTVNSLDITLLSFIVVNTFTCEPTSGNWSEMPPPGNVNIGDDVLRLRLLRNIILHQSLAETTDQEFEKNWSQVIEILVRRQGNRVEYDKLKEQNLDPEMDRQCRALLERWQREETEVKDALSELKESNEREHTETRALVMEGFTTTRGIIANQQKQSEEKMDRLEKRMERLEVQVEQTDFMQAQIPIWRKEDSVFCSTKAADAVLKKLESKNVVTIVGGPGCGKSMMSKHMALEYEQQGYKLHVLLKPEKIIELYSKDTKHVFMFDDPIGVNMIDSPSFNMWKIMDPGIRNVLQQNNVKVIITMRSTISNCETVQGADTVLTTHVINITGGNFKLSTNEKNAMFQRHCPELTPPKDISDCMYDIFPLLCRVYCESKKDKAELFKRPFQVLKKIFQTIHNDNIYQFCALVLCAVVNDFHEDLLDPFLVNKPLSAKEDQVKEIINAMGLEQSKSYSKIKEELHLPCDVYIQKIEGVFKFQHAIFKDIVLYLCGRKYTGFIFKYFPSVMIRERVRIGDKLPTDGNEEFLLVLEDTKKIRNLLAVRFQKDLQRREFRDVFLSPYVELPEIEAGVSKYITENRTDLDKPDRNSMTILHWAVSTNIMVKYVIDTVEDINTRDSCGYSSLHYATMLDITELRNIFVDNGQNDTKHPRLIDIGEKAKKWTAKETKVEIVKSLLEKEANVNAKSQSGLTVLDTALRYGNIGIHPDVQNSNTNQTYKRPVSTNCIEIINVLIENGADVNAKSLNQTAPIILGALSNNVDLVTTFIQKGANVNAREQSKSYRLNTCSLTRSFLNCLNNFYEYIKHEGFDFNLFLMESNADYEKSPIFIAATNNNMEMVKILIENCADVNTETVHRKTPIIMAVANNNLELVKVLIENGADVNIDTVQKVTAINLAVQHNNMEMVKILIENGANVNAKSSCGMTPIIDASANNNLEIVKLLVQNGVDVNIPAIDGKPAIIHAACNQNPEMVQILVENGANVNAQYLDKPTAIHIAAAHNNLDILQILIENGANVNLECQDIPSAILLAVAHNNLEMLQILIENGANVNEQFQDMHSAILAAMAQHNLEMVQLPIENGANVNVQCQDTPTAILEAVAHNNLEMVQLPVENGASVNVQCQDIPTAIFVAIIHNNLEMVQLLIEHGANVNVQCQDIPTAIQIAVAHNNLKILQLLIEHGANVNVQCQDIPTAIQLAVAHNNLEMVQLLIENGANVNVQFQDTPTAILVAVAHNNLEMVQLLIENGANVNVQCQDKPTTILLAVANNNLEMLHILIEKGADVSVQSQNEILAFILAAENNNLDIIKILIENGADVNAQIENGVSAIIRAAENNNLEIVKILIENGADVNVNAKLLRENGADVNAQFIDEITAIFMAIGHNNFEMVKLLIENGAEVNLQNDSGNSSTETGGFIALAAENNNMDLVQILLENGANVNVQRRNGYTAIIFAALKNNLEMMKILIENGADVNVTAKGGVIAILIAVTLNNFEMVNTLIGSGADVNVRISNGISSIILAVLNNNFEMVEKLIENGADVNAKSNDEITAIYVAARNNLMKIAKLLIENGADVNVQDQDKLTVIYFAVQHNNLDMVNTLIDHGAGVNVKDQDGKTPIYFAVQNNNLDMVNTLIDHGAGVNVKDQDGKTPIYFAADHKNLDMVKTLIDHGAGVNVKDQDGKTPIYFAAHHKNLDMVKTLIDHGADVNDQNNDRFTMIDIPETEYNNLDMVKFENDEEKVHGKQIIINPIQFVELLAKKGVEFHVRSDDEDLIWTAANNNLDMVKLLIAKSAYVNVQSKDGCTAVLTANYDRVRILIGNDTPTVLLIAVAQGNLDMVEILIEKGANVDLQAETGMAAIIKAAEIDSLEIVNLLIKNGADVNVKTRYGITALIWACFNNNLEMAEVLIDNRVNLNVYTKDGISAITIAATHNNLEMVKILTENGADANISAMVDGQTAITLAAYHNNLEMIKILAENGANVNVQDKVTFPVLRLKIGPKN